MLERGQIDKGFDRRPRLPFRLRRAVELADLEAETAAHGQDAPGMRVHRDERARHLWDLAQIEEARRPPRCRAALPTSTVPSSKKLMTLGTKAVPLASRTTTGRPWSMYAARLKVVPRSMPTIEGAVMLDMRFLNWALLDSNQ